MPASPHQLRFSHFLLAVALLASALALPLEQPALGATELSITPGAIDITLPLGESATHTLTINNASAAATPIAVYEALASSSAALTNAAPAALAVARLPTQAERIDPQLAAELGGPNAQAEFLVYLERQADLSAAYKIRDWAERGRYVVSTLKAWAAAEQRPLMAELRARGLPHQSLWVVNALLVRGDLADVEALAGRADVALVRGNHTLSVPATAEPQAEGNDLCSPDEPGNPLCWNVRRVGADRVWRDFGVSGQGIVLGSVDTGVFFDHPALAASYRGYLGPDSFDHSYNWFDPQGATPGPSDTNGHGTHTMGTLTGRGDGTVAQPSFGVAPGARWVTAQGCDGLFCSDSDLIAAAQWVLAPTLIDGSQPRPDLRPMIINNSWAGQRTEAWYAPYTAAWRAAGIFPVFAAGNTDALHGQECGSVASPGDYADVLAVGAVLRDDTIAPFSLLGPSRTGRLKPDFAAPGAAVYSAALPAKNLYQNLSGTSMAAPHVAGVVALMWSANPALIGDYDATYRLLRESAYQLGDTRCGDLVVGPNNVFGYGIVDAYAAVARARVDVPWLELPMALQSSLAAGGTSQIALTLDAARVPGPGVYQARVQLYGDSLGVAPVTLPITLRVVDAAQQVRVSGQVVSAATGAPLAASLAVSRDGQDTLPIQTSRDGLWSLTLPAGDTVTIVVSAPAYATLRQALQASADQTIQLALQPDQPQISAPPTLDAVQLQFGERRQLSVPIENTGSKPLHYRVDVPPDPFVVARSDAAGGPTYSWVELPESAARLKADRNALAEDVPLGIQFPFYGFTITDTVLTGAGLLAFDRPFRYDGPSNNCLPDEEFPFYSIAPLRADFDLAQGGQVRYGTVDGVFVASYEGMVLHDGPADQTYTFQVLLYNDGRVVFQYRDLAPLPFKASAGIQRSPFDQISIGCGPGMAIGNGLAIELLPQEPATAWLSTPASDGVLQPGQRTEIPLEIGWVRPGARPLHGALRIISSDPLHAQVETQIRLTPNAPPNTLWLQFIGRGF